MATTKTLRMKEERIWLREKRTVLLLGFAEMLRRRRLTKKQRKAEDFFLGKRPPRPWYWPRTANAYVPKWDENRRRVVGHAVAQATGEAMILRQQQKPTTLKRVMSFLEKTFQRVKAAKVQ